MQAHREGTPMLVSSGYVARVDEGACTGCGLCARVCPFEAVRMAGPPAPCTPAPNKTRPDTPVPDALLPDTAAAAPSRRADTHRSARPVIARAACMGCGVCELRCPGKAIHLALAADKPAPLVLPGEEAPVALAHPDLSRPDAARSNASVGNGAARQRGAEPPSTGGSASTPG